MLIQGIDGRFYKNPYIWLPNKWLEEWIDCPAYIYANDDVGVKITCRSDADIRHTKSKMYKYATDSGLVVKIHKPLERVDMPIGPNLDKFCKQWEASCELLRSIYEPNKHDGVFDRPAVTDRFLAWRMEFTLREIKDFMDDKTGRICTLGAFLSGNCVSYNKASVMGKIYNQHINIKTTIDRHGDSPVLDRLKVELFRKSSGWYGE